MRQVSKVLEQTNKILKAGFSPSRTEVGQIDMSADKNASTDLNLQQKDVVDEVVSTKSGRENFDTPQDHIGAISQIFSQFQFAYHNQFHKAFPDAESLVIAKKYWLSSLQGFSPSVILAAGKKITHGQTFLPSLADLVSACETGDDLFGLPNLQEAYLEACSAPSPKCNFSWSHPAVYFAGKAASWFLLANESPAVAQPVFEYHYKLLCDRVRRGEALEVKVAVPLTDVVHQPLERAELRSRLAKLRRDLKL
jgi:hypothetical protein